MFPHSISYTRARNGLDYTYTHLRLVVGLNKVHKKYLKLWLVYTWNKALEETKVFNCDCHMLNLVYDAMFMPFAWGQAKIQVWGSLMSR